MNNIKNKIAPFALWLGALALRKTINFSRFIAPHFVIVTPLLGSFLSATSVCSTFAVLTAATLLCKGLPITLGIPTFFATLSWTTVQSNRSHTLLDMALHLILPLVCMALFIAHPTGNSAAWYTLYWFIPMIAWAVRSTTIRISSLLVALQSTFVAHAVGSVIWIYTVPMTAEQWLALIPIVAIERLTIAGSSALLYEIGRRGVWRIEAKNSSQRSQKTRSLGNAAH